LGSVKRPYVQLRVKGDSIKPEALITRQTEGLRVGFKEWVDGWMGGFKEWVDGWDGWAVCEVKTTGFIKPLALGWMVCEVWVDRWAEGWI
jgi:hypothetical protein